HRGDGVAFVGGGPAYVPYALPGEHITVEADTGHPVRGRLLNVEQPSPDRISPFCAHFTTCGGCAIQHWRSEAYRAWQRSLVVDALAQAGIACPVHELIDAHGSGRRRIVAHARRGAQGSLRVGFAAASSHEIVAIDRCPILDPALNGAFSAARALTH